MARIEAKRCKNKNCTKETTAVHNLTARIPYYLRKKMKRLYMRDGTSYKPIGWICEYCTNIHLDENACIKASTSNACKSLDQNNCMQKEDPHNVCNNTEVKKDE